MPPHPPPAPPPNTSGPHGPRPPESGGTGGCTRPDLAASLPLLDEVEPGRRAEIELHARSCPRCGPALELLRKADAWLEQGFGAQDRGRAGACPTSEELYDYGRGPGYQPLAEPSRRRIEAHLSTCAECRGAVGTLERRPPVPLQSGPLESSPFESLPFDVEGVPAPARPSRPSPGRRSARRLPPFLAERWSWVPLAAAAGLLLGLYVVTRKIAPGSGADTGTVVAGGHMRAMVFPEVEELRGDGAAALLFPRDRVLVAEDGRPLFRLAFEVTPRPRAGRYRIDLERHAGGAFERGERVARLDSADPLIPCPADVATSLAAGHYTWSAWAVVDGLDVELGRRDFELALDEALLARLAALSALPEPDASERVLEELHARGHLSDARAFARTLPPSSGRDAYLEGMAGR